MRLIPVRILGALLGLAPSLASAQSGTPAGPLARVESAWLDLINVHDELRMTRSMGGTISPRGNSVSTLDSRLNRARKIFTDLAATIRQEALDSADLHAFGVLGERFSALRDPEPPPLPGQAAPANCSPGWQVASSTRDTLTALTAHVFECYGREAQRIVVDGETLDRLTVLGLLGRTDDPARRQRLFMGLQPVWRSVNGDDSPGSPYRRMVALRVR